MGATEATQMGVGNIVVVILRLAADAMGCIGYFRFFTGGDSPFFDPVENGFVRQILCKGGSERTVRIQTEQCIGSTLKADTDVFQRMSDFTVPIELITKKIGDEHNVRFELAENRSCCSFIAFDHSVLFPAFAGEGTVHHKLCHNSAHQVGAGAVDQIGNTFLLKGCFNHTGCGGFSVRPGYSDCFNIPCQKGKQVWTDFDSPPAGHGSSTPMQQA